MWFQAKYDNSQEAQVRANNDAHMVTGISYAVGMVSSLLFGYLYRKMNKSTIVTVCNLFIISGYLTFVFLGQEPKSVWNILSIVWATTGGFGITTVSYIILNQFCGQENKSSVFGFSFFVGALGNGLFGKLSGYPLEDSTANVYLFNSPFLALACFSALCIILVYWPGNRSKLDNEEEDQDDEINGLEKSEIVE